MTFHGRHGSDDHDGKHDAYVDCHVRNTLMDLGKKYINDGVDIS